MNDKNSQKGMWNELRHGNVMAWLTQKVKNRRFIQARKFVFDEDHPDELPKTRLVLEIITGFIAFRLIKGLLRLVELGLYLTEKGLSEGLNTFSHTINVVASMVKYKSIRGLIKGVAIGIVLLGQTVYAAISATRLIMRAIISPVVSFRYASNVEGKWLRRLAQTASVLTTIGGWVLLSLVAFPWVVSQVPGLLPLLKPLMTKIVMHFHFLPTHVFPTLTMIKTAGLYALWIIGTAAVASVVTVSSLLHVACNPIVVKQNMIDGFKVVASLMRGLTAKKECTNREVTTGQIPKGTSTMRLTTDAQADQFNVPQSEKGRPYSAALFTSSVPSENSVAENTCGSSVTPAR